LIGQAPRIRQIGNGAVGRGAPAAGASSAGHAC
jgi:hypothetical protein